MVGWGVGGGIIRFHRVLMSDSHWVISTQEVKFKYIQMKWYDSCTEKNPSLNAIIAEYVRVSDFSLCSYFKVAKWSSGLACWYALLRFDLCIGASLMCSSEIHNPARFCFSDRQAGWPEVTSELYFLSICNRQLVPLLPRISYDTAGRLLVGWPEFFNACLH